MYSIHQRLGYSLIIVLGIFLGLIGMALDRAFVNSVNAAARDQLQGNIYALLGAADETEDGHLAMPMGLPDPRYSEIESGLYAEVAGEHDYSWRSHSLIGSEFDFLQWTAPGDWVFREYAINRQNFLTLSFGVDWESLDGVATRYTFAVAQNLAPQLSRIQAFRKTMLYWFGGLALALLLAQFLILRWGLKPLRQVEKEIGDIENGRTHRLTGAYPRELTGLTNNLNSVLSQSVVARERYRHSLDDLAHSLKTPLALLLGALGSKSSDALERTVHEQVDRMNGIVQHQLKRAAASGKTVATKPVPICKAVTRLKLSLDQVYRQRAIQCQVDCAEDYLFLGDEADLLEILGNVLENAYKYGQQNVTVIVTGADRAGFVRLDISDDGKGIDQALRPSVLKRGYRLDERQEGQGIGLSVVAEIVDLYDGSITIGENRSGNGACFSLTLPGVNAQI